MTSAKCLSPTIHCTDSYHLTKLGQTTSARTERYSLPGKKGDGRGAQQSQLHHLDGKKVSKNL